MKRNLYSFAFVLFTMWFLAGCGHGESMPAPMVPESTIYSDNISSTEVIETSEIPREEPVPETSESFEVEIVQSSEASETPELIPVPEKEPDPTITVYEEQIAISGLTEPFELIYVSDTHLALCDERDAALQEYMVGRYEMFRNREGKGSEDSFKDIVRYVTDAEPDLLVLGGDITDAATLTNIEYLEQHLSEVECPVVYGMGNHDFNYGNQEYFSERSYQELLPRFQNVSRTSNGYQVMEFPELIVFAVDDKNNQIPEAAVQGLENAIRKGKPILLMSHVPFEPLEESSLLADSINVWGEVEGGYSKVIMGNHGKIPNEQTERFFQMICAENSPVELVLSGHVHFYHKDILKGNLVQIISGPGFQKEILKIELLPK